MASAQSSARSGVVLTQLHDIQVELARMVGLERYDQLMSNARVAWQSLVPSDPPSISSNTTNPDVCLQQYMGTWVLECLNFISWQVQKTLKISAQYLEHNSSCNQWSMASYRWNILRSGFLATDGLSVSVNNQAYYTYRNGIRVSVLRKRFRKCARLSPKKYVIDSNRFAQFCS